MPPKPRLIELPERIDARGALTFAQQGDHIPFTVKRFFALHGVAEGTSRGGHAHREQHQFLVMLSGQATVIVDDGVGRIPVLLDRPNLALYAPPMLWLELDGFSAGAICMVLTSDVYQESDYVRDRAEFLRLVV
ncbi:MAG TPA: FdtA/QdtA family cupin domain-containing protein [Rhizomicrobium sp.]|jgi:dTDP-4-dehydrorhamnose 3,5-epimerase-like enzyme